MKSTFTPNCYGMNFCFKRLVVLLFFIVQSGLLNAQSILPEIWLKPDSLVGNQLQFSQHGLNWSAIQLDSSSVFTKHYLNGNPIMGFGGNNSTIKVNSSWLKGRHLQVLIAYVPDTAQVLHGLYQFRADSNLVLGVTNSEVLQRNSRLMYSDTLIGHGVVSSVKVFTMHHIPQTPNRYLQIGKSDSINFKGNIGEVLVFNRKTRTELLPYYETYLALKYGISLTDGNYTTLNDTIWSKTANAAYHFDVAGLGTDSICGLMQRTGESSAGDLIQIGLDATLLLSNSEPLPQGSYVIWGRNNRMWYDITQEPITFDSSLVHLNREWKIQTYGRFDSILSRFFVRFNTNQFAGLSNPLLLIKKNENDAGVYHLADSLDSNGFAYYRSIIWDADSSGSDFFSFAFPLTQQQSNGLSSNPNLINSLTNTISPNLIEPPSRLVNKGLTGKEKYADLTVFPVPSSSIVSSQISVPGGEAARLEVYNNLGAKVDEFDLQGSTNYLLHHSSLSQGQYMFVLLSGGNRVVRQVLITK